MNTAILISNPLHMSGGLAQGQIAPVSPINVGPEHFACHLTAGGPLNGWAALGRNPAALEPVIDVLLTTTDGLSECSLGAEQ